MITAFSIYPCLSAIRGYALHPTLRFLIFGTVTWGAHANELARRTHVNVKDDGRGPQRERRQKRDRLGHALGQREIGQRGIDQSTSEGGRCVELAAKDHGLRVGE